MTIPIIKSITAMPEYNLVKADFFPFDYQDDKAEEINDLIKIISGSNLANKEDRIEFLEELKLYICSALFPNGKGGYTRLMFQSPKDLEKFLKDRFINQK